MILATPYDGKTVGVLGLGKAGAAAVAALTAGGARVVVWDDTPGSEALQAVQHAQVKAMQPSQWPWESLAAMVLSPGIPYTHPVPNQAVLMAQAAGVPVVGEIEVLYRSCPLATYMGITGTNRKSTTTALIGHILTHAGRAPQVGGNLGTAGLALSPLGEGGTYVLEMSSYQLDLLRTVKFHVAVHLNLSEDHLDRHGSMEGYFAAKQHIFDRQGAEDVAVIGVDDAWSEGLARGMIGKSRAGGVGPHPTTPSGFEGRSPSPLSEGEGRRIIPISVTQTVGNGIHVKDGVLHNNLAGMTCDLKGIKSLQGAHNWQNAAAAYAACFALGVAHEVIAEAMQSFSGLAHRMQWLGEVAGVSFVNDSKATNADAAEKALLTYDRVHWILGGVAKEGGIAALAKYFPKVRHAYLIGEASDAFAQTLEGKVAFTKCGALEEAFLQASLSAEAGETVLLAPACASFDQYKNFEKRGEHFAALYAAYAEQKEPVA